MRIAKVIHADHGVDQDTLLWTLTELRLRGKIPEGGGFIIETVTLPETHAPLLNGLYGPACGDAPVADREVRMCRRSEDRPPSRMVALPKRETRLLSLVGLVSADGEATIFTAYGGPLALREPGDASMTTDGERAESKSFWAVHALASDPTVTP